MAYIVYWSGSLGSDFGTDQVLAVLFRCLSSKDSQASAYPVIKQSTINVHLIDDAGIIHAAAVFIEIAL